MKTRQKLYDCQEICPCDFLRALNYVNNNEELNDADCFPCDDNCEDCSGCIKVEMEVLSLIKQGLRIVL